MYIVLPVTFVMLIRELLLHHMPCFFPHRGQHSLMDTVGSVLIIKVMCLSFTAELGGIVITFPLQCFLSSAVKNCLVFKKLLCFLFICLTFILPERFHQPLYCFLLLFFEGVFLDNHHFNF